MGGFKIGDRVRYIGGMAEDLYHLTVGREYDVVGLYSDKAVFILNDIGGRQDVWNRCLEVLPNAVSESTKDTNPKDALGTRKVPILSVLPLRVLGDVALALFEGARKYGRHNYRPAGVRASVYMDAAGRHLAAWYEGEDIDPDSGVNHISKAIAALMVLRDSMMQGNWNDDRPPKCEPWVSEMNKVAEGIIEKYPNCVQPHTANGNEDF